MKKTTTAPSVLSRKAATAARKLAEDAPQASTGRPRRKAKSASLYVLSIRLTPDEEIRAKEMAKSAGLTLAEMVRKFIQTGAVSPTPVTKIVEIPSRIDADFARQVNALGVNLNQLSKSVNLLNKMDGQDTQLTNAILSAAESVRKLSDQIRGADRGTAGRVLEGIKLVLGSKKHS